MNVKRYIAGDAPEAISKIREELGRDAFILNQRLIRAKGLKGLFKKPMVEVVAAYEPQETARAKKQNPMPPIIPVQESPGITQLETKLESLAATVQSLAGAMHSSRESCGGYSAEVDALFGSLLENEVHEEFAHKIAREATGILAKKQAEPREVMEQILRQMIGEPSPLRLKPFKRTVVLLAGSTGVGKTTTLAKLAAIHHLNHNANVGIISADTYRIAAVDQLKIYAEILETPLSVVYSPEELPDALREHEDKDLVFIDTAGRSPKDRALESEIASMIKLSECDEVHLVLSATTGFAGLLNIITTYGFLKDYKMLYTKFDENPAWGVALNAKFLTDRPISYISLGQTVPDDIEVMDPGAIVQRLLGSGAATKTTLFSPLTAGKTPEL